MSQDHITPSSEDHPPMALSDRLRNSFGRLNIELAVDRYDLPDELGDQIKLIVRRTRLYRREKFRIADALAADAREMLDDGLDAAAILRVWGPAKPYARALRSSTRNQRPLLRRWLASWRWWAAALILPILAGYSVLAFQFHTARPVLTRDFAGEFNARLAAIPDEEKALDLYLQAFSKLQTLPHHIELQISDFFPDVDRWDEAVSLFEADAEAYDLIREAARRPHLGRPISNGSDERRTGFGAGMYPVEGSPNPPLLTLIHSELGVFRGLTRRFQVLTRIAAHEGDAQRVLDNLSAMLGFALHARHWPGVMNDLVSIAILGVHVSMVGELIDAYPGLFSHEQLGILSDAIASAIGGAPIPIRLEGHRAEGFDFVQRAFTDDGKGDGRFCAAGLRSIDMISGGPGAIDPLVIILGPLNAQIMVSRAEFLGKWEEFAQLAEQDWQVPHWRRSSWAIHDEVSRIEQSPDAQRYKLVTILANALPKAIDAMHRAEAMRVASLVVIALERYRLDHGAFPERLQQLIPGYLREIPIDRYDGQPIKYILRDGSPLLYSVGPDGIDDGGADRPEGYTGAELRPGMDEIHWPQQRGRVHVPPRDDEREEATAPRLEAP